MRPALRRDVNCCKLWLLAFLQREQHFNGCATCRAWGRLADPQRRPTPPASGTALLALQGQRRVKRYLLNEGGGWGGVTEKADYLSFTFEVFPTRWWSGSDYGMFASCTSQKLKGEEVSPRSVSRKAEMTRVGRTDGGREGRRWHSLHKPFLDNLIVEKVAVGLLNSCLKEGAALCWTLVQRKIFKRALRGFFKNVIFSQSISRWLVQDTIANWNQKSTFYNTTQKHTKTSRLSLSFAQKKINLSFYRSDTLVSSFSRGHTCNRFWQTDKTTSSSSSDVGSHTMLIHTQTFHRCRSQTVYASLWSSLTSRFWW